jgi:hypothetical protein
MTPKGAEIIVASEDELPNDFNLFLSQDRKVGLRCRKVWHEGLSLGLCFVPEARLGRAPRVTASLTQD